MVSPDLLTKSMAGLAVVLVSSLLGWVALSTNLQTTKMAVVESQLQTLLISKDVQFEDLDEQLNEMWPLLRGMERDIILLQEQHKREEE